MVYMYTPCLCHRVSSSVMSFDPKAGSVTLNSGEKLTADIVLAADGVRSKAHQQIVGEARPTHPTSLVLLRFIIPTEKLLSDPRTADFAKISTDNIATYYRYRHASVMRYPCRSQVIIFLPCLMHCILT